MITYDEKLESDIAKLQAKIEQATAKRIEALKHPTLAMKCFASTSGKFVGECACPQCVEIRQHIADTDTLPNWLTN